jgi:hypothetical protein
MLGTDDFLLYMVNHMGIWLETEGFLYFFAENLKELMTAVKRIRSCNIYLQNCIYSLSILIIVTQINCFLQFTFKKNHMTYIISRIKKYSAKICKSHIAIIIETNKFQLIQ